MAESGLPLELPDSSDSPEYSSVLRHIADINQRIPPAERSTFADELLQAGLIAAGSHTNATGIGTGIPHHQLISSLMAEAMAKIKTCSKLFYRLIAILRKIDNEFATKLTTECSNLGGVEIADQNRQNSHLSLGTCQPLSEINSSQPLHVSAHPVPPISTFKHSSARTLDNFEAEIRADDTVVSNLSKLEIHFGRMIVRVKHLLDDKCDLSDAKLFLFSAMGIEELTTCDSFAELLVRLQHFHISVFNISVLHALVTSFDEDELTEVVEAYNRERKNFLNQTTVLEFQQAVVDRVKPILASGMAAVTIKIPKELARRKTLHDIEQLALDGFEECHKKFIHLHAEPGSIIISWIFPEQLNGRLEELACDNAEVFESNEVLEITIAGRIVFPYTEQVDISPISEDPADLFVSYSSYLKGVYTSISHFRTFQHWANLPHCEYIKLAMIEYGELRRGGPEEETIQLAQQGKIETIMSNKRPVSLSNILFPHFVVLPPPARVILIEGAPGGGKSTLVLHICHQWVQDAWWLVRHRIVVLVHLRDRTIQNATTLADILSTSSK